MPAARSLRRTNPITIALAGILCVGFLYFIFSTPPDISIPKSAIVQTKGAAANVLSPPSLPFRKPAGGDTGEQEAPPVVHYHMNNLTTSSEAAENKERVLILTPLAKFYQEYWDNLLRLSYPHELISLGFIIPKGREGNAVTQQLQEQVGKTQGGSSKQRFGSVTILRQDTESPLKTQAESERHKMENQKARRAAMAKARNSLLFTTLGPTTAWVLWLDADIVETRPTLIQDLTKHDKPIIVPNCFQRYFDDEKKEMDVRPYDYNSWIDSPTAQQLAETMDPEDILLEGYQEMPTFRSLMAMMSDSMQTDEWEIQLDGVGGTALMVKADVHRDGAMFPPFAFYHLIETEGFAKMAKRLGWQSWGLPNYFVYHYNE